MHKNLLFQLFPRQVTGHAERPICESRRLVNISSHSLPQPFCLGGGDDPKASAHPVRSVQD